MEVVEGDLDLRLSGSVIDWMLSGGRREKEESRMTSQISAGATEEEKAVWGRGQVLF